MELKQYFKVIYKRLWLIVLIPFIAASVSAYFSFYVMSPVYESNTTLYVINKKIDTQIPSAAFYNDLLISQVLVNDYRELIKSRSVTSIVIGELKLSQITPETLAGKITVSSKNETRLIEVKVQDTNPKMAKDIAEKTANVFINKAIELMKVENVNIIDGASLPINPIKPKPFINIVVSMFLGMITAVGFIFLLEYLDSTLKTSEDMEKYLGLSVIGTIPTLNID